MVLAKQYMCVHVQINFVLQLLQFTSYLLPDLKHTAVSICCIYRGTSREYGAKPMFLLVAPFMRKVGITGVSCYTKIALLYLLSLPTAYFLQKMITV